MGAIATIAPMTLDGNGEFPCYHRSRPHTNAPQKGACATCTDPNQCYVPCTPEVTCLCDTYCNCSGCKQKVATIRKEERKRVKDMLMTTCFYQTNWDNIEAAFEELDRRDKP